MRIRGLLLATSVALCLSAQTAPKKTAAKPAAAAKTLAAAPKKSALDKATLEAYVRHLNGWGPQIQMQIADPKPASLAGFVEVSIRASQGPRSAVVNYLISKDGQKILRGDVFDVAENPFKTDLARLKTEFQPSMGTPGAPVVLVVFSDFQCGYCKEEAKMLRANLLAAYPKQVRLYFKDYPLEQIHPWAKMASIAGRCVFRQNPTAFWDYHDWVFENQGQIGVESLKRMVLDFAQSKNLDALQLSQCLDTRATEAEINRNIAEAQALGINSTPTLFINGRRLQGQLAWPDLRALIDLEIEYQKTARNAGEDCACDVTLATFGK